MGLIPSFSLDINSVDFILIVALIFELWSIELNRYNSVLEGIKTQEHDFFRL